MNSPSPAHDKILPLTSLRFFLAFALMLGHGFRNVPSLSKATGWLPNFLDHVFVLCPFFFFLSGFVVAWGYLRPELPSRESTMRKPARIFWLTRFARLYPLCIAAMLIDLPHYFYTRALIPAAAGAGVPQILLNFAANLGMLQAWFPVYNSIGGANWAISNEIFFYLLFPWIGVWLWRLRPRDAWPLALALYPIGLLLVLFAVHLHLPVDILVLKYNPLLHLYEFLLGVLLARAYLHIRRTPRLNELLARCAVPMAALSAVAVTAIMAIPSFLSEDIYMLLQHCLLLPLFALIILAFASSSRSIDTVFSAPILVVLGEASYGIFLLHFPMYNLFRHAISRYDWPMFAAVCVVIIALSVASVFYFETPLRRRILASRGIDDAHASS